jgi:hypothetical protein
VSWDREAASAALVDVLSPAVSVTVHQYPPAVVNPLCVVIGRPTTVMYSTVAPGIDEASVPVIIVGAIETEDQIEALKELCRDTIAVNATLGAAIGPVFNCYATEERNWRNFTGAGGIQLLQVELVVTIQM